MNSQTNVDGPLHLVDPSVHYDTVNALAFDDDSEKSVFRRNPLCGRSNTEVSSNYGM